MGDTPPDFYPGDMHEEYSYRHVRMSGNTTAKSIANSPEDLREGFNRLKEEKKPIWDKIESISLNELDYVGKQWSLARNSGEGDYDYRQRLKKLMKGE
jgi:hypothetical protein